MKPRLHVLAIGGSHQFAHFLQAGFELARRGRVDVTIFVPSPQDRRDVETLAGDLGVAAPRTVLLALPAALSAIVPRRLRKLIALVFRSRRLRSCEAILCAERTSTILKRLPGRCPPLIHIPHGAGDRAVGFERRFRLFDKVIVAGPKDRDRLIAEGVVSSSDCDVAGPIKVASLLRRGERSQPLFSGGRPVILYNPHFSPGLSSAQAFARRLADAVTRDGRHDLIIAPHVRMAETLSPAQRRELEALAIDGRILVDLGSRRSVDMTYTLAADLYVGDVSSQVYEFLVRPRPCLFVNAHDAAWEGSEDYAMWRFGPVVTPDCDIPEALALAFATHDRFRAVQMARTRSAFDGLAWTESGEPCFPGADPAAKAADLVERYLGAAGQPAIARTSTAC